MKKTQSPYISSFSYIKKGFIVELNNEIVLVRYVKTFVNFSVVVYSLCRDPRIRGIKKISNSDSVLVYYNSESSQVLHRL